MSLGSPPLGTQTCSRSRRSGLLLLAMALLALSPAASCRSSSTQADDVARLAQRLGTSTDEASRLSDDLARATGESRQTAARQWLDELEAPRSTPALPPDIDRALQRFGDELLCDAVYTAAFDPQPPSFDDFVSSLTQAFAVVAIPGVAPAALAQDFAEAFDSAGSWQYDNWVSTSTRARAGSYWVQYCASL
jgi:hypothetical protein